jgi:hypothetical protein
MITGCALMLAAFSATAGYLYGRKLERRKWLPVVESAHRIMQASDGINRYAAKLAGDS